MQFLVANFFRQIFCSANKGPWEDWISASQKSWVQVYQDDTRDKSLWHQRTNIQSVYIADFIQIYDRPVVKWAEYN